MRQVLRRWWWAFSIAAVAVVALVVWLAWPDPAEPRAREYRDVTVCLLTDDHGVAGTAAAPVWAGLQDASNQTHGQVRYLPVTGEQTAQNAKTFLGSLILGRCGLIVGVGEPAAGAIRASAAQYPQQRFLIVGAGSSGSANLDILAPDSKGDVQSAVSDAVLPYLASAVIKP